ncbi:helix-turn-helix transcriptional regulator [Actinoallomurus liliacearum]|uniref:Helix-turn-helix transcriptional regulator n=1 Tax=Actinoallomurus liliacearum TaxID=1080073 RepID=A0ABP8TXA3_9ACTN
MVTERISPTLRRRRLASRLRQLREQADMTVAEAAKAIEWTPSKITWIETNRGKRPNPRDVRDLCDAYEVTNERERAYLEQLARDGRLKGWWDPYGDVLPHPYENYVGLEAEAATVLNFELGMIPGLLQTEDYARAMIQAGPAELAADKVDKRVEVRIKRQAALRQDPGLRLVAVIDEAALHRQVGSTTVMRAQLQHLVDIAEELSRVTIQVVPFIRGAHSSMTNGFVILQFPESEDPDVVYVENAAGGLWLEDVQEITGHHVAFQHLLGNADSAPDTIAMIAKMARS